MIQDRIDKIQATVNGAQNLPEATRAELLRLLAELKTEVAPLAEAHGEGAQIIAEQAAASVHEATRSEKDAALADAAIGGLTASVEGFEASHPQLVQVVNRIAVTLSNMGI
jgi:predicted TIM-barrel enzyme